MIDLCGTWQLRKHSDKKSIPAQIPGDNFSALLENDLIPDPYYRDNEKLVQWIADEDWTYERSFTVPKELLDAKGVVLNFDSIDTVGTVYVNDQKVAAVNDQFKRWRFEVKSLLKAGKNTIRVELPSVRKASEEYAKRANDKISPCGYYAKIKRINMLRKTQCSSGWDWGISCPSSGMMGQVYLMGVDMVMLDYVFDKQVHRKNSCEIEFTAELTPAEFAPIGAKVAVEFAFNGEKKKAVGVIPRVGKILVSAKFTVKNPELWWPNGFGEQPLYPVQVTCDNQVVTQQIGLKELKIINEKDEIGFSMIFQVNGVRIFAKGADWIPCDALPQRHTAERYAQLLGSVKAANMNMVRLWGGGKFEEDAFYEECDRLGILVWHDNMFACAIYPDNADFLEAVNDEIVHQVKRLRHHACIGIWCGDNELIGNVNSAGDDRSLRDAWLVLYDRLNRTVGRAVTSSDDTHVFWPSSPCAGPNNYADNWTCDGNGDMHYWAVWHGGATFEQYYDVKPRFCSEFGFQSFPSLETVKTFAEPKDYNVFSPVFDLHQKGGPAANSKIIGMFGNYFKMPNSFEGQLYLSQVQQGLAIKTGVEYWHSLRPRCMGTIFWQLNDNWPVASWASLEYSGRWKVLQYMAKRFYAPVSAVAYHDSWVVQQNGERAFGPMQLHFISDLPERVDADVTATLYRMDDGRKIVQKKFIVKAARMGDIALDIPNFYDDAKERKGVPASECFMLVEVSAKSENGKTYNTSDVVNLDAWKYCELPEAKVAVESVKKSGEGEYKITLSTDKPAFFAWLAVQDDPEALFNDNAITLLPGKTVLTLTTSKKYTEAQLKRKLSLIHLRMTY